MRRKTFSDYAKNKIARLLGNDTIIFRYYEHDKTCRACRTCNSAKWEVATKTEVYYFCNEKCAAGYCDARLDANEQYAASEIRSLQGNLTVNFTDQFAAEVFGWANTQRFGPDDY